MRDLDDLFARLHRSRFRSSFVLGPREHAYLEDRGLETVLVHARDFVARRLAPARPDNDGKQTPYRGHPVFIAQHATATCCRTCLAKWHGIPAGRALSAAEQEYVVAVIRRWLGASRACGSGPARSSEPQAGGAGRTAALPSAPDVERAPDRRCAAPDRAPQATRASTRHERPSLDLQQRGPDDPGGEGAAGGDRRARPRR